MTSSLTDLAGWLARMEGLALEFYQETQKVPGFSPGLVEFLKLCGEEESWHLNAVKKAARLLEGRAEIPSDLKIDGRTVERVEPPFRRTLARAGRERIGPKEILEAIAATELSEWNPAFVYLIGRIAEFSGETLYPAARVQSHLRRIIDYFEMSGFEHEILRRLKTLPLVWGESILAVDDEEGIRQLLAGILQTQGRVDLARDGREALGLLKNHCYKVIITDLSMPRLDGLGLFRKARELYPGIAGRFIFLSGEVDRLSPDEPGIDEAVRIRKPFRAWELIDRVRGLLRKAEEPV